MPRLLLLPLVSAFFVSCSEDAVPAPYSGAPVFADDFEASLDTWDQRAGRVIVTKVSDAPSGSAVLRAESRLEPQRTAATVSKKLKVGSAGVACRFFVRLTRYGGTGYLSVARLDVSGGALFFELKEGEWRYFLQTGGVQDVAESAPAPMSRWHEIALTIEDSGKLIVSVDGLFAPRQIDTAKAPLLVSEATLEVGLLAPPADVDTDVELDRVSCTAM